MHPSSLRAVETAFKRHGSPISPQIVGVVAREGTNLGAAFLARSLREKWGFSTA